jgi:hypothetical protein
MTALDEAHETERREADAVKQRAMRLIENAIEAADADGVPADAFAHVALFAAITTFVDLFGEPVVAAMMTKIPDRIVAGDYTLDRTLQ